MNHGVFCLLDLLIFQPFSAILRWLYVLTGSFGLALILFQLVIKAVTFPFAKKGKRGMLQQQMLAPKQKELEAQFKGDKQKYQAALQEMYQKEGVNPMSGCLWNLLPMPILFMVFAIVRQPITYLMRLTGDQIDALSAAFGLEGINVAFREMELASRLFNSQSRAIAALPELRDALFINFNFLGLDLAQQPAAPWVRLEWLIIIPILSCAAAYGSMLVTNKINGTQLEGKGKMLSMMMPLMSLWFGFIMPAAMGVFWIASSVFQVAQDLYLTKHYKKVFAEEAAEREKRQERQRLAEAEIKAENQKRRDDQEAARKAAARAAQSKYKLKKKPGGK